MNGKGLLYRFSLTIICMGMGIFSIPHSALAEGTIRINGSGTCVEMLKPLMQAYKQQNPQIHFEAGKSLGSSGSLKALMANALDIAVISRPLKSRETAAGVSLRDYGKTPLIIVANKNVEKKNITTKELEDIFAGTMRTWPDGSMIRIVLRPQQETDTKILKSISPGLEKAINKAHERRGMLIALTDAKSMAAVIKTKGSIGASTLTHVLVGSPPIHVLKFNGVEPCPENVKNKSYPLFKYIGFATKGKTNELSSEFIAFVYSEKGRAIAQKYGVLTSSE